MNEFDKRIGLNTDLSNISRLICERFDSEENQDLLSRGTFGYRLSGEEKFKRI